MQTVDNFLFGTLYRHDKQRVELRLVWFVELKIQYRMVAESGSLPLSERNLKLPESVSASLLVRIVLQILTQSFQLQILERSWQL